MAHSKYKLNVCIDANIYISGLAFGGKPAKVIELALEKKFNLITGTTILAEVKRNLVGKLELDEKDVNNFIDSIIEISTVYQPTGAVDYIDHKADNLVLETALLGNADILVTGDKKDLLPLKTFNGIIIEPPSAFIIRLETENT